MLPHAVEAQLTRMFDVFEGRFLRRRGQVRIGPVALIGQQPLEIGALFSRILPFSMEIFHIPK